jgi:hypothetical protein
MTTYREEIRQPDRRATAPARIAVPRALHLLAFAGETIAGHSFVDGRLRAEAAASLAGAVVVSGSLVAVSEPPGEKRCCST